MVELRLCARSDGLRLIRCVVQQAALLCSCPPEIAERLVLAVNEACMNVIQHAYRSDPGGELILQVLYRDRELIFRLMDFASPVDPATCTPCPREALRPGGLGLHLISETMDEACFLAPPQGVGNLFQMSKRWP